MDAAASLLSRLPHFGSLSRATLEEVAASCRTVRLDRGQALFRQGEAARDFFVVAQGAVRVFRRGPDGREHPIHHVRPGQSFAEAAVFRFGRYPVHAEASRTPTEVLAVPGEAFLALLRRDPELGAAMVAALCQRLREMVDRLEELALPGARARVCRWLLRQPARAGPEGELRVELALSKKELAAALALAPETLSRVLAGLAAMGAVRNERRAVVLRDPDLVEDLAGEAP